MISLIIPTYHRPRFLRRTLLYYQKQKLLSPIVVADSSSAPTCEENRSIVASFHHALRLNYELYCPDIYAVRKLAQALDKVHSKYAVICGDEDFIVPTAMERCVDFLEANPEYSAVDGREVRIVVQPSADHDLPYKLTSHTLPHPNISLDDPKLRLLQHLTHYAPTFYSVHHRSHLMRNMQLAYDYAIDYRFSELLASCLSLIQGKYMCLDTLYIVRQVYHAASTKTESWPDMFASPDFSQRYAQFRKCLAEELVSVAGVSAEEANNTLDLGFWAYRSQHVRRTFPQRVQRVVRTLPAAARSALLDRQLIALIRSPREAYHRLLREREPQVKCDAMSLGALLDTQLPFHADFLPISELLRQHPYGCI